MIPNLVLRPFFMVAEGKQEDTSFEEKGRMCRQSRKVHGRTEGMGPAKRSLLGSSMSPRTGLEPAGEEPQHPTHTKMRTPGDQRQAPNLVWGSRCHYNDLPGPEGWMAHPKQSPGSSPEQARWQTSHAPAQTPPAVLPLRGEGGGSEVICSLHPAMFICHPLLEYTGAVYPHTRTRTHAQPVHLHTHLIQQEAKNKAVIGKSLTWKGLGDTEGSTLRVQAGLWLSDPFTARSYKLPKRLVGL